MCDRTRQRTYENKRGRRNKSFNSISRRSRIPSNRSIRSFSFDTDAFQDWAGSERINGNYISLQFLYFTRADPCCNERNRGSIRESKILDVSSKRYTSTPTICSFRWTKDKWSIVSCLYLIAGHFDSTRSSMNPVWGPRLHISCDVSSFIYLEHFRPANLGEHGYPHVSRQYFLE